MAAAGTSVPHPTMVATFVGELLDLKPAVGEKMGIRGWRPAGRGSGCRCFACAAAAGYQWGAGAGEVGQEAATESMGDVVMDEVYAHVSLCWTRKRRGGCGTGRTRTPATVMARMPTA